MKKKGSHVGMVLSFVVFVTFLFLLYSILSPSVQVEQGKKNLLNYLKISLIKDFSVNVTAVTIRISDGASKGQGINCFEINDFGINGNIIVKDKSNQEVDSFLSGNMLRIAWGEEKFFKIYYSEEFNEGSASISGCQQLSENTDYVIGSFAASKYVSISELNELEKEYNQDYEVLKKRFNIPNGSEFDFEFTMEEGDSISVIQSQTAQNVYAEEVPVQYVDWDANIKYGFLKLRAW